jgi:hypothetical protein
VTTTRRLLCAIANRGGFKPERDWFGSEEEGDSR